MKAPSKSIEATAIDIDKAVTLNGEVNSLSVELKTKKDELKEITDAIKKESLGHFQADMGPIGEETQPQLYGNHEYISGNSLVTVNYKMKAGGMTISKFGPMDACDVLPKVVGADYPKLFTERKVLTTTVKELEDLAKTRPDLVAYSLDPSALPEAALTLIKNQWPDAFSIHVADEATYIDEVPTALVHTEVTTSTGFLAKVAKLPDDVQLKLRDFTRKVVETVTTSAVKYGNRASSK